MKKTLLILSALVFVGLASAAIAADPTPAMMKMKMPESIYAKDMAAMHDAMMNAQPTGDADIDFVQGMIPHHEGAVAMAKTVIANGKDPEIRKLAEDIVKAQDKEIAFMKDWMMKHPAPAR